MNISRKNIVGIGIGPSNLSLAALLNPMSALSKLFVDKKPKFKWHEGMLLPHAKLQVHYLKDLVALVDPTNPFSFLSFLRCKKRLYQFINANFQRVSRAEFNEYYEWVANTLPDLKFNSPVREISISNNKLAVHLDHELVLSDNIVLGCGQTPFIPDCARNKVNNTLFHSSKFKNTPHEWKNKDIVVVGGGQTGAEIIYYYLNHEQLPRKLTWVTKRSNFLPLDESPFVNELFTPAYSNYFFSLPEQERYELIKKQKLYSDGISFEILEKIYQKIYELNCVQAKKNTCSLMTSFEMMNIHRSNKRWLIDLKNKQSTEDAILSADIVVLCTGFRYETPDFLTPLADKFAKDASGHFQIKKDYSLIWDNPRNTNIYLQNGAITSRGVADPNLSLSAWRSATIVNSIMQQEIYDIEGNNSFINWSQAKKINNDGAIATSSLHCDFNRYKAYAT